MRPFIIRCAHCLEFFESRLRYCRLQRYPSASAELDCPDEFSAWQQCSIFLCLFVVWSECPANHYEQHNHQRRLLTPHDQHPRIAHSAQLRPVNTIAATGVRATERAQHHTSAPAHRRRVQLQPPHDHRHACSSHQCVCAAVAPGPHHCQRRPM